MSVCLFACLFGLIGAQTTRLIPTKFGIEPPLVSVGNLKILFWVDPPEGGIILEKLKNPNFPHMAQGGILLRHLLRHLLRKFLNIVFFFEIWILLNGPAKRSEVSQRAIQRVFIFWAAKRPAPS